MTTKQAYKIGQGAFLAGKPSMPVMSKEFMSAFKTWCDGRNGGKAEQNRPEALPLMKAFNVGWMFEQNKAAEAALRALGIFPNLPSLQG